MRLEEKIKEIRRKEQLSQERFAERLQVSRQTVINWEKGTTPAPSLLVQIANEFHIDVNSLINEELELKYIESIDEDLPVVPSATTQEEFEAEEVKEQTNISVDEIEKPLYIVTSSMVRPSLFVLCFISFLCLCYTITYIVLFIIFKEFYAWDIFLPFVGSLGCLLGAICTAKQSKAKKVLFFKDKFIIKQGLFNKREAESRINGYKNFFVYQTFWGKIFHYGIVKIDSYPYNLALGNVKYPEKLKKFFIETYEC